VSQRREDALLALAMAIALAALAAAITATVTGCRRPEPAEPRVLVVKEPCLASPPPGPIAPEAVAGPEHGCPAEFIGCITPALFVWIEEARVWMRSAWNACSPRAEGETK
jgi:hypothetical protein